MDLNFPFDEIFDRIKQSTDINTQGDLASFLKIKAQGISRQKKRNIMLTDWVMKVATVYNISVDWLLYGDTQDEVINTQIADTEDPEIRELLNMTNHILKSNTEYAESLSFNIRSFYRSVELEERLSKIENVLAEQRESTQQRISR